MKKLQKLVLQSFIGPFVMTFFIAQFVLLMQFLWKYIDDLIGKGLDWWIIGELLFYTSATLIPLALPLAILVSSIMTFGNLAEHFEITAAKASGVSLQKLMMPLFVAAGVICVLAFFFSNNILPITNLKMGSLLYDIRQQKPALAIREGVFYSGIEGYSIKIGSKDPDGKTLHNVMIYDHSTVQGNKKVILAEGGKMETTPDQHYLMFTLYNGNSYEEQNKPKNNYDTHPLMRNSFSEYVIRFDLSQFKLSRTNEDLFKGGQQMMDIKQLTSSADSLVIEYASREKEILKNIAPYFLFIRDSAHTKTGFTNVIPSVTYFPQDKSTDTYILDNALNTARSLQSFLSGSNEEMETRRYTIAKFDVEWHRKFTLSVACFVLFLIGAPLGAIIRKGGMGMPLVVSILFFLLYHITSITGEKLAKEGNITPLKGMWMSTFILLPVGIFLIYKATHDSTIFDIETYKSFFKRILGRKDKNSS